APWRRALSSSGETGRSAGESPPRERKATAVRVSAKASPQPAAMRPICRFVGRGFMVLLLDGQTPKQPVRPRGREQPPGEVRGPRANGEPTLIVPNGEGGGKSNPRVPIFSLAPASGVAAHPRHFQTGPGVRGLCARAQCNPFCNPDPPHPQPL